MRIQISNGMKIVFLSNKMTPHQKPLSDELYRLLGGGYSFIESLQIDSRSLPVGWKSDETPPYLVTSERFLKEPEAVRRMINDCDVLICGSAPEELIADRLRAGKLTFKYSERIYKTPAGAPEVFLRKLKYMRRYGGYDSLYLLCASAFAYSDYVRSGVFRDRAYQWGYFPVTGSCDMQIKQERSILWCGRLLDWKHPQDAVTVARRLAENGVPFRLTVAGTGEAEPELRRMIDGASPGGRVELLGEVAPERARELMEESSIFLFTSDRQEGWGAVLNEAMSAGCAAVASHAAGATPYLINNGKNGIVYRSGDTDMLYRSVKKLLDSPELCDNLGSAAHDTIHDIWNERVAAQRLIALSERILSGEKSPELYEQGPCAKAPIIRDDWF